MRWLPWEENGAALAQSSSVLHEETEKHRENRRSGSALMPSHLLRVETYYLLILSRYYAAVAVLTHLQFTILLKRA